MRHDGPSTTFNAGAAIAGYRIVKHGAADGEAVQASDGSVPLIGVTGRVGAASGGPVDVIRGGVAEVEYGDSVTRGAQLTSDSDGRAVPASPDTGANVHIIGVAEVSGAAGDIGSTSVEPQRIQG